ncbi:hypothetical protein EXA18_00625 [Vibrio cincinnatiensis]|uniref:hypothetical protein n=1 Tax=Vibrio cincinnatiensis TaxID=675 RepID=UPI001EE06D59|nr:hypothetical protein [Vibrio cincinnatiensis]MCG3741987.1 hypothetical protein [Vibrio cincinnatiensis]
MYKLMINQDIDIDDTYINLISQMPERVEVHIEDNTPHYLTAALMFDLIGMQYQLCEPLSNNIFIISK